MAYYTNAGSSRSPPPLQHPIPTHPLNVPEPPATPLSADASYQRFSSSPSIHPQQQQQQQHQPYTAHNAYSQQQSYSQQPGIHGHGPQPNLLNNQFAGMWGVNDATAQLGIQLGQNAVAAGQDYVQKNFNTAGYLTSLKHHFNVSNSYVLHKLRIILFPWRHKPWSRKFTRTESGQSEFQPPRDDLNSPDLYIPSMALVTYVLLISIQSGLSSRFSPEVLGTSLSKALAVLLLEFIFVKTGCYILSIPGQSQVLDLVAYGGYKFVSIIPILVAGLAKFSRTVYWLVFAYSFSATAFFLLRSLRYVVLPDPSSTPGNAGTVTQAQRGRRIGFLFIVAIAQFLYLLILVNN